MEENDELSQLEELLCDDLNNDGSKNSKSVKDIDLFSKTTEDIQDTGHILTNNIIKTSEIHNGDTDSSDDEEKRNYTERKYNDYGSEIKKMLDNTEQENKDKRIEFETRLRQTNRDVQVRMQNSFVKKRDFLPENSSKNVLCAPEIKSKNASDVFTDPIFGIRIIKPVISSTALLDRMQGREAINMLRVKRHVENEDLAKDWVIAGVIVRKSSVKKSQKGNQFMVWTLSDLKDDLKTISMFLFRKAYSDLWKTTEGTVVAVLNPCVLDKSSSSTDQACLSVESPERVMILGQSKDLGFCKSRKKNGEPCTAFVNLNQCEHCIYHVKKEYQKYSTRQELQSSTMGKGLVNLQNKLLGKSTMIYGGKTYTALPTGNTKKVQDKDKNRLMSLTDYYKTESDSLMMNKSPHGSGPLKINMDILHSPATKKTSDSERLNTLSRLSSNSHSCKSNVLPNLTSNLADRVASSPKLGRGLLGNGTIDLSVNYRDKSNDRAKANALKLLQKHGGIEKMDPNNIKGTESGKKRALEKLCGDSEIENENKKVKVSEGATKTKGVMSERFKKILEATSAHQNLIKQHEDDEQDKYFNKLQKKEAMEEKMLNTFKLACKAVRCTKCKYTAFSASQHCKDERHPLKILDTFKRFFKCGNCSNRTVSLEIIPLHTCSNCNSSKWEKAPMMREKKVQLSDGLSIRGEEETFIGGLVNSGKNINLLVPDS